MKKTTQIFIGVVMAIGVSAIFSLIVIAQNANSGNSADKNQGNSQSENLLMDNLVEEEGSSQKNKEKAQVNNAGEEKKLENSVQNSINKAIKKETGNNSANKNSKNEDKGSSASNKKVGQVLKEVAKKEKGIEQKLNGLADHQKEFEGEVVRVKSEIKQQKQNVVKSFLLGTDYENLGQLRSSMVRNRNNIRQLINLLTEVEDSSNQSILQEQLENMEQEREELRSFIKSEEESFGLFGWAFRWINDYQSIDDIDEAEEQKLDAEIEEALN